MTRVLIIDDEDLVRRAIRFTLEKAGFEAVDLASGRQAVDRLDGIDPDLVIVDLVMPDQDGFDTIAQIQEKNPAMRIIAVTGGGPTGPDRLLQRVSAMGVAWALKKPVDRDDLIAAVKAATGRE
ncbi:MAG: response regulator [Hyphomicrobiales bacterium]|nr:response regulator [Hyphomicrobiales bacterium]